jgi:hypothetical protein
LGCSGPNEAPRSTVGKRFVGAGYAGYIVGFDHRREGGSYLVRYEDGDLLPFPARELDTYRNYYASMQNRAPPPPRVRERCLYWINSKESPLASVTAGGLAMLLLS